MKPELTVQMATPEDVVLTKLSWYVRGDRQSELQLRDIVGILRVQKALDLGYLRRWAPVLQVSVDLEKLLAEYL